MKGSDEGRQVTLSRAILYFAEELRYLRFESPSQDNSLLNVIQFL